MFHNIILVITAEDGAHMVVGNRIFNIQEYSNAAIHSHTITTTIHRINMSTFLTVIVIAGNVDVNESVGLDGLVIEIAFYIV